MHNGSNKQIFYFAIRAWFEGTKEYVVEGVLGPILKLIIDFCYTGRVALTKANANEILSVEKCHEFWAAKFPEKTLVTQLNTDKHNLWELCQKSLKAVCADFENIPVNELQQKSWTNYHMFDILNNDEIIADETSVFNRLAQWLGKNEVKGAKYGQRLLSAVSL